jgi:hypothetical protein
LDEAGAASHSDAVGRIGFQAHIGGHASIATRAWAKVTDVNEPAAEWIYRAAELSWKRREPAAEIPPRERLLKLAEVSYGPNSVQAAASLNKLGGAWRVLGQPGMASDLHERALRIQEREFGSDHPELATILNSLGTAWRDLGQPGMARDLHERALRIQSGSSVRTIPSGRPSSTAWATDGWTWGSRARPATCTSGRCASRSMSSVRTIPRWLAPSTTGQRVEGSGAAGQGPRAAGAGAAHQGGGVRSGPPRGGGHRQQPGARLDGAGAAAQGARVVRAGAWHPARALSRWTPARWPRRPQPPQGRSRRDRARRSGPRPTGK